MSRRAFGTKGDAAQALRRQRFADRAAAELSELHRRSAAWAAYLAEAGATPVDDGFS